MSRRHWFVGSGLATLALASTLTIGTAFAQESGTPTTSDVQSRAQTFIERLAGNLGLSSDQVEQGIKDTREQFVDDAVDEGRITAEQGEAMRERIESGEAPFMFGRGFKGELCRIVLQRDALADALGMTNTELREALNSGQTLEEIISDQGKTVDEVVDAALSEAKTRLDQAVADGDMTQDQADERLDALKQKLTDSINNNTVVPGGFGGPHNRGNDTQATPTQMS